jgi:hypothetical protein
MGAIAGGLKSLTLTTTIPRTEFEPKTQFLKPICLEISLNPVHNFWLENFAQPHTLDCGSF